MTRTPDEQEQALAQDQTHEPPAATQQAVENILAPGQELALARLSELDGRNHQDLADLLLAYPELREAILAHATQHFGNATVARALALVTAATQAAATENEPAAALIEHEAQADYQTDPAAALIEHEAQADYVTDPAAALIEHEAQADYVTDPAAAMIERETQSNDTVDPAAALIEHEAQADYVTDPVAAMIDREAQADYVTDPVAAMIDREVPQEEQQKSADVVEPVALDAKDKEVIAAVDTMTTNDDQLLAATLTEEPELRGPIVMAATEKLGADTVAEAIEVQHEQPPQEQEEAVQQEPPAVAQAEIEQAVEEPATAQKQQDEWARNAAAYNERHAAFVEEFHNLTGGTYRLPDGSVDPAQVIAWQQENNIQADGKIGPQTVAAARAGAKKPTASDATAIAPAVEEQQEEEQPPPE